MYKLAKLDIVMFETEDVIVTSNCGSFGTTSVTSSETIVPTAITDAPVETY